MYYLEKNFRKTVFIGLIGGSLMMGWWLFAANRLFISNFQPYHLKSYSMLAGAWFTNLTRAEAYTAPNAMAAVSIPVLTYHGVLKNDRTEGADQLEASEGVNVSIETFKEHMRSLKSAGYQTVTLDAFRRFMAGEITLPDKSFLLTFDDGRRDSFYPVDPILKALDYHAVMFVITKFMREERTNYYLTLDELRIMERSGRWEIQSHGKDDHETYPINVEGAEGHYLSNLLWRAHEGRLETEEEFIQRIQNDLVTSRNDIEAHFKIPVIGFAFPFGDWGYDTINFPRALDLTPRAALTAYPLNFYQTSWRGSRFTSNYNDTSSAGAWFIKRMGVEHGWSGDDLMRALEATHAKPLPFSSSFQSNEGWLRGWGVIEATPEEGLSMRALEGQTGSVAILDGSRHWREYDFRARVKWDKGSNIYLYARFLDDNNFVGCNFGRNVNHIEQTLHGVRRVIKGVERNAPYPQGEFEIGMRVQGRRVECLVEDAVAVDTDFLAPELDHGGIGLKAWDALPQNSEMTATRIAVTSLEDADPPLIVDFSKDAIVEETAFPHQSTHPSLWLNSGGAFIIADGVGQTLQGDQPKSRWQEVYANSNPIDSDQGDHPQNLFRLILKQKEENIRAEGYFRVRRNYFSASPQRGETNGIFFLLRYQDQNALYALGARVDGQAVIKKKTNADTYSTMAEDAVFPGQYARESLSVLFPLDRWIGLRAESETINDHTVVLRFFMDLTGKGEYKKVLEASDDGAHFNGEAILSPGYIGIRTDFMDVEFDNIKVTNL